MSRTVQDVMHHWGNRGTGPMKSGNVSCENGNLYSYAACIAAHHTAPTGEQFTALASGRWSVTTSKHQTFARRALPRYIRTIDVNDPQGAPRDWLIELAQQVSNAIGKAQRARTSKSHHLADAEAAFAQLQFVGTAYGIQTPDSLDGVGPLLAQHAQEVEAERQRQVAERAERDAQRDRENAAQIEAWLRGENYYCPTTATPRLRLSRDGREIETSWGARVPVRYAEPLIKRSRECRGQSFNERVGNYTLSYVSDNGSLTIGCHVIAASEVERMAAVLAARPSIEHALAMTA